MLSLLGSLSLEKNIFCEMSHGTLKLLSATHNIILVYFRKADKHFYRTPNKNTGPQKLGAS